MTGLHLPRSLTLAALALLAVAAVACGGSSEVTPSATPSMTPEGTSDDSAAGAVGTLEFPYATGPAVLVPDGYEPPGDRVASTGAFIPANGKPTLVFVDAIW